MPLMSEAAKKVLHDAMELDDPDRALVAAELIASLDGTEDADVEAAWALEIDRRVSEIEAGTAELSSWADVRRRIESEILRR
jgi:hypothetical protein